MWLLQPFPEYSCRKLKALFATHETFTLQWYRLVHGNQEILTMPRPGNILLRTAMAVVAVVVGVSPAFAKGGGGHGGGGSHASSGAAKPAAQAAGSKGGKANLKGDKGENSIRHMLGGGRGGRGGGYYPPVLQPNGNLVQSQNNFVGQTFSGPAHIGPAQYGQFVQSYSWPAHRAVQTQVAPATTGDVQVGQAGAGN
jgi:hypothetical protein